MRVVIDTERCTGHGRCYSLAPAVFTDDDDEGYGVLIGDGAITADQLEDARRAVLACPERAIAIEDERS
jgi:ferredoxin